MPGSGLLCVTLKSWEETGDKANKDTAITLISAAQDSNHHWSKMNYRYSAPFSPVLGWAWHMLHTSGLRQHIRQDQVSLGEFTSCTVLSHASYLGWAFTKAYSLRRLMATSCLKHVRLTLDWRKEHSTCVWPHAVKNSLTVTTCTHQ